ncbi:MAG: putative Transposase [Acidobacteriales bacterium]|nr:putative Transposase [Terriglobales bacterium]
MTVIDLCQAFSSDERCRELLERLRWPDGAECLRCKGKGVVRLSTNSKVFWCAECDYQFSVLSGTIFHDTHLELIKWFTATYLLCESRKGMSANQIKRTLGVSYKTAWYLCHRIRAAMKDAEFKLSGIVEIDETYVGGKGKPQSTKWLNKTPVIGIRERGGRLHFIKASNLTKEKMYDIIAKNVANDVEIIVTDESKLYNFDMTQFEKKHKTVCHSKGEYVRGEVYTNTVESAFSLLKRGIIGTWHRVSPKHLPAYLDEMTFRFNRRKNSDLFLDTLKHMVTADPLTFEKLTA